MKEVFFVSKPRNEYMLYSQIRISNSLTITKETAKNKLNLFKINCEKEYNASTPNKVNLKFLLIINLELVASNLEELVLVYQNY